MAFEPLSKKAKIKEEVVVRPSDVENKAFFQMYRTRPKTELPLPLNVFEELVQRRMKLLSKLYELDGRRNAFELMDAAKGVVDQGEFQFNVVKDAKYPDLDEDSVSHFALRLALCVSERWRQWFLKYEVLLFGARISQLTTQQQRGLLRRNNIKVEELSQEELNEHRSEIEKVLDIDERRDDSDRYYKVPFQKVLRLVERRKVLLKKGWAIVPHRYIMQFVEGIYRAEPMGEVLSTISHVRWKHLGTFSLTMSTKSSFLGFERIRANVSG
eukprot:NODE_985_length_1776_cov_41.653735_g623_i1.p1 GENE.NODE_985_length_1776_cov_41.653735_g623_i1~~NODE_985_length_1776_cov_41.653735_g623_i1.p1  ORF type:complete len:270 (-),score=55.35 NODE_985_length_1776_cov_41.653735_g623_i1:682-1491(-)